MKFLLLGQLLMIQFSTVEWCSDCNTCTCNSYHYIMAWQVEGTLLCRWLLQPRFEERRLPRLGVALKESPRREGQRLQEMMTTAYVGSVRLNLHNKMHKPYYRFNGNKPNFSVESLLMHQRQKIFQSNKPVYTSLLSKRVKFARR